jgi:hypothetical protein
MRMALSAFVVAVAICGAAYAQQGRSCSDVAANAKQTCSSSYRPVVCQNNIEQQRTACLQSGTWQRASGPPINNLRRE